MLQRAWVLALTTTAVIGAGSLAADQVSDKPGWTGLSNPKDVIAARQGLMTEMERLMQPIDSYTVGEEAKPADLRSAAQTISRILAALPHLFPPTTDLYDPKAEEPVTIALPAVWQSYPAFTAFAEAASKNAAAMAEKTTPDALRAAGTSLRAACDACHTLYLRAYVPEAVNDGDKDFDFDSVFENQAAK